MLFLIFNTHLCLKTQFLTQMYVIKNKIILTAVVKLFNCLVLLLAISFINEHNIK